MPALKKPIHGPSAAAVAAISTSTGNTTQPADHEGGNREQRRELRPRGVRDHRGDEADVGEIAQRRVLPGQRQTGERRGQPNTAKMVRAVHIRLAARSR